MAVPSRPAFHDVAIPRGAFACTLVTLLLAGCAGIPGAAPEQVELATMLGPTFGDTRQRALKTERYAFARARVPITITGRSVLRPASVTGATPTYAQAIALAIGTPKYAPDTTIATRIAKSPGDVFVTEIDDRRLLRSVSAPATASASQNTPASEIKVLEDITRKSPPGPAARTLARVSSTPLPSFRHEAEIDPAAAAEIEALNADLERIAGSWRLKLSFEALTVDAEIGGQRITLGPTQSPQCSDPVCFRVPIPYRLRVAPEGPGWTGKLETSVWLPNDGPVGSLDVRHASFAGSGLRARFENGMLQAISVTDRKALAEILRLPSISHTASISR